ncbi:MAG: Ribonuclease P protein component [Crocinitomicaceae bacterium]|nr:MAG: Ribonuclease P protein component [Crocinitomicaceae bacterium]
MPFEKNKVLFSVSKKHIPKTVERNKIKRQMHAIYFNNLELFLHEPTKAIALTYVSKSPTSFIEIKKSMTTLFSII